MSKPQMTRIDKLLSSMGYGSRNDIARLAKMGDITLDGGVVTDASKRIAITSDLPERMLIGTERLDPLPGMVIMLNKPLGMTCSHRDAGALVYDLLPDRWRRRTPPLSTVGRLDKDTSGLLLMTDDGALLHKIISPKKHIKKTYHATLARPLTGNEADTFASGTLTLYGDDKPLLPAELSILSPTQATLTITEGRYHQVRRMFAATGNHVTGLHRTTLGGLTLPQNLSIGDWRVMTLHEIAKIFD